MDEQLTLEKLLSLTHEEMKQMRMTEDRVLSCSLEAFQQKKQAFEAQAGSADVISFYRSRIESTVLSGHLQTAQSEKTDTAYALAEMIKEVPRNKTPVVIAGGSFNSDSHRTKMHAEGKALIDSLLCACDPGTTCFVIGHSLSAYEKYLAEANRGRFDVFCFVPSALSEKGIRKIRKQDVNVRVSIESAAMGIYKSIAYEIFKQRNSLLIALDGNSPAANMIQEANNAKYECRIFIDRRVKTLAAKADQLQGYVTVFNESDEAVQRILKDLNKILSK
jgi:hypothetical protein